MVIPPQPEKLIRFDWAIKTILRDKANFDVLEGFLSALLNEPIQVIQILESESNQADEEMKYNRVDILITDSQGRHIIIEIQNSHERDYLYRLLFGTSKVIIDTLQLGQDYQEIAKVISISILYFNLGSGNDYVYYGTTNFIGLHTEEPLRLKQQEQALNGKLYLREVNIQKEIYPEYYLIQVERFEDVIQAPLDEWIYMLKHEEIRDDFSAPNIDQAREKLSLLKMDTAKRRAYERYMMSMVRERDAMRTAKFEGRMEGQKEGRVEGRVEVARNLKADGLEPALIMKYTGLSLEEVEAL